MVTSRKGRGNRIAHKLRYSFALANKEENFCSLEFRYINEEKMVYEKQNT